MRELYSEKVVFTEIERQWNLGRENGNFELKGVWSRNEKVEDLGI